jgi:hypothetical protein
MEMSDRRGAPDPALLEALVQVPSEAWASWLHLATRGGVTSARPELVALMPIPGTHGHAAITILATHAGGLSRLHQLALRRWAGAPPDGSQILFTQTTPAGRAGWALTSAWDDPVARAWLWEALSAGATLRADGWEWEGMPEHAAAGRASPFITSAHPVTHPAHDVIAYPPPAFATAYRELTPGQHIELEVLRHLERSGVDTLAPALLGYATVRGPAMMSYGAAVLQAWVPDADPAEQVVADRLFRALQDADPSLQVAAIEDLRTIGVTTRALHAALGWPFGDSMLEPAKPATAAQVEVWSARARTALTNAWIAAPAATTHVPSLTETLTAVGERLDRIIPSAASAAGVAQRIHGNLTLASFQMVPDGPMRVCGFSGDPLLPPNERRAPQSPWRDVARLMHAITELSARVIARAGGDAPTTEIGWLWEREARKALLDGYGSGGGALHALTSLFEVEFACATLIAGAAADDASQIRTAVHALDRLARSA